MKILLIGHTGLLGQEILKQDSKILFPENRIDIFDFELLDNYISETSPDIIINCAAKINNREIEKDSTDAIKTNIIGASNLAIICRKKNIRLVYISTDYIYKGDRGNYKETDEVLPSNLYSWTKLGGECSAMCVNNHLIIRTSFGKNKFDYPVAFCDKYTSKDYVDVIAPMIYDAAISSITGVLNIGTERKTMLAHALERNKEVKEIKVEDSPFQTTYDSSLNLQKWINAKSEKSLAKSHNQCRICGSKNLTKYLDMGLMPLANNLEFTAQRATSKERFPLQVMYCNYCGLSQLSVIIDPEKMFSYYTYRSSVNGGYVSHCREMAKQLKNKYNLNEESFCIDIAGNDGALLKEFRDEIGCRVLNVDPATNLTAIAESFGIESICDFWGVDVAIAIEKKNGKADIITATNVFAHVDSLWKFMQGVTTLLKTNGVLVIEVPYLIDFIENCEFDTVYFEHLSYISVLPVMRLCSNWDMKVINIEKQNIHGGTIRISISRESSDHIIEKSVSEFVNNEISMGYNSIEKYTGWSRCVKNIIDTFNVEVLKLRSEGYKIAAFAASAKGNTMLNACGISGDVIRYIADETPEKIGKFSPGTGIKIVNKQILTKDVPDYLVILSWNFAEEIMEKARSVGYAGKFIIPVPEFKIID